MLSLLQTTAHPAPVLEYSAVVLLAPPPSLGLSTEEKAVPYVYVAIGTASLLVSSPRKYKLLAFFMFINSASSQEPGS